MVLWFDVSVEIMGATHTRAFVSKTMVQSRKDQSQVFIHVPAQLCAHPWWGWGWVVSKLTTGAASEA